MLAFWAVTFEQTATAPKKTVISHTEISYGIGAPPATHVERNTVITTHQTNMKNSVYTLRISLQGIEPEIWRTCQLAGYSSFGELHEIIQIVMGWNNVHPFRFLVKDKVLFDNPSVNEIDGRQTVDSDDLNLDEILVAGDDFLYEYKNLEWKHRITVTAVAQDTEIAEPICTGGAYHCPPDGTTVAKYVKKLALMPPAELAATAHINIQDINDFLHECHDLG